MKSLRFSTLIILGLFNWAFSQDAFDAVRIVQDEMGFGARALGMGGAYTSVANDYTAIYWNPAGLADVRQSEFYGGLSHLNFKNDATFADEVTNDSENYTHLRSLGLALPFPTQRGSFVLGLGYNRVKDFDQNLFFSGYNHISNGLNVDGYVINPKDTLNWDTIYYFDKDVKQTEQIIDEGGLGQWSFSAAISLSPNFDAGLAANIYSGNSDYSFTFLQEDEKDVFPDSLFPANFKSFKIDQSIKSDYSAFNLKVGGTFKLKSGIRIGAAIGLPTTFNVKEKYSSHGSLSFDDGFNIEDPVIYTYDEEKNIHNEVIFEDGQVEYKVKTPMHFDGGISYSNRNITLAASMRYRDWSQTKMELKGDVIDDPFFEENQFIRQNFRATLQYNLGGELYLDGLGMKLRGGYSVYPSPLENAISDMDKKFISAGVGFKVDRNVDLDLAYRRGTWKQQTKDIYTPGGTLEDITVNKFFIGLSYNF